MSTTAIAARRLTDYEWSVADLMTREAKRTKGAGITPSQAARAARVDIELARELLGILAARGEVTTTGNGTRTRYHAA